jgi:glycosyltransferase involved in cell wall biosynthesis
VRRFTVRTPPTAFVPSTGREEAPVTDSTSAAHAPRSDEADRRHPKGDDRTSHDRIAQTRSETYSTAPGRLIRIRSAQQTVVLALGGATPDTAEGACDGETSILLSDVPGLLRRRPARRCRRLVISGGPPQVELGFGLAGALAIALRPEQIELRDTRSGDTRTHGLAGYLAASTPFAVAQLAASAAAIPAQRLAAATARPLPRQAPVNPSSLARVVYLRGISGTTTGVGGSVTHTHEVIRALRNEGIEIAAVTTDAKIAASASAAPEPPCDWRLVEVPRLFKAIPASTAFGSDTALARAALADARDADLIYQRHGRFSLSGAVLSRLSGKPLFLEYNGTETFFHDHWQRSPLGGQIAACEGASLSAAARIIVVSEVDRRDLIERGYDADAIVLNPNGVDASRFDRGGGAATRAALGLETDDLVVGFVGSFGPWHGAPLLAEAFVEASALNPRLRLLLVGDGPDRARTEALVAEAGMAARARFVGSVPSADVPAHLDACDVLCASHVQLPGGAEFFGSPTKLFEYMAAGKAIAASNLGQIGDVLEHEETALLVQPSDPSALASALARLAQDPELRRSLGAAARLAAVKQHGWDRNAARIVAAYRDLAERGR